MSARLQTTRLKASSTPGVLEEHLDDAGIQGFCQLDTGAFEGMQRLPVGRGNLPRSPFPCGVACGGVLPHQLLVATRLVVCASEVACCGRRSSGYRRGVERARGGREACPDGKADGGESGLFFIVEPFKAISDGVSLSGYVRGWCPASYTRAVSVLDDRLGDSLHAWRKRNGALGSHARRLRCNAPRQRIRSSRRTHFLQAALHTRPARRALRWSRPVPASHRFRPRATRFRKSINRRLKNVFPDDSVDVLDSAGAGRSSGDRIRWLLGEGVGRDTGD